jgi:prophage DNA circulation protein
MSNDGGRESELDDRHDPELRDLLDAVVDRRPLPSTAPPGHPKSDLRLELEGAEAEISAREAADRAVLDAEIKNFKSAVNETGELLHPHYGQVEAAMNALAQSYVASEQPVPSRVELYEAAVWANSSTRTALLASQKQAEQSKAAEEARAKAASAGRARPRDEELAKVLEKHGLRDNKQGKTTAEIVRLISSETIKSGTEAELEAVRTAVGRYYKRKIGKT